MSSFPRGRDEHGVVHYCYGKQGQHRTLDPWCMRQIKPRSYGEYRNVVPTRKGEAVTCFLCLAIRNPW